MAQRSNNNMMIHQKENNVAIRPFQRSPNLKLQVKKNFCQNVHELTPGTPRGDNNLAINVTDLNSNVRTIHRSPETTVKNLQDEVGKRILINGKEPRQELKLKNILNPETRRVLFDPRPRKDDLNNYFSNRQFQLLKNFDKNLLTFGLNYSEPCEVIYTQENFESKAWIYVLQCHLSSALYGRVMLYVKAYRNDEGKYFLKDNGKGDFVAIKHISKNKYQEVKNLIEKHNCTMSEDPLSEIAMNIYLKNCEQHPNLMTMHEAGHDNDYFYIVMPFANGTDLCEFLANRQKKTGKLFLPENDVRYLIRHMARGLLHAHKNGIVMNDVSLENTMLHFVNDNISPLVFLMDWGMAKYILANDYGERICDCNIGKFYGKLAYMAPEVWTGSRAAGPTCDGIPADVWSLCICALVLAAGDNLWIAPNEFCENGSNFKMVKDGKIIELLEGLHQRGYIPQFSDHFKDFLKRVLIVDEPYKRLPLPLMLEHPFVTGEYIPSSSNKWSKYKTCMDIFQELLVGSYKINNDLHFNIDELRDSVKLFRGRVKDYSQADGDVDVLIHFCNNEMKSIFDDSHELAA